MKEFGRTEVDGVTVSLLQEGRLFTLVYQPAEGKPQQYDGEMLNDPYWCGFRIEKESHSDESYKHMLAVILQALTQLKLQEKVQISVTFPYANGNSRLWH